MHQRAVQSVEERIKAKGRGDGVALLCIGCWFLQQLVQQWRKTSDVMAVINEHPWPPFHDIDKTRAPWQEKLAAIQIGLHSGQRKGVFKG